MTDVHIIGAAATRFGKFADATVRALSEEAVTAALNDSGLTAADVDTVFFSNAAGGVMTGQEMIRGQVALRHTGLLGVPIVNVENACASGSTAFRQAVIAVQSGDADVALVVGSEKLSHPDRAKSFAAIGTAVDLLETRSPRKAGDGAFAGSTADQPVRSPFMDIYAAITRAYMDATGATVEDFAEVVVKNRGHAALNPKAQYREPVTVQQVVTSRTVCEPLTLLMCSPIGDGAAALVVCSADRARYLDAQPVRVQSSVLVSGTGDDAHTTAVERAATRAYEHAGIGPDDIDILEVHDAAAPAELLIYEKLGLCKPGAAPKLLRTGETALGGRRVVNPSGGLVSKGHPIGASGCAQLVELADQLRGRCGQRQVLGARIALAENAGGFLGTDVAAATVTILSS